MTIPQATAKRIMKNDTPAKKALDTAYNLLSRRPHSSMELKEKLAGKGFPAELIEGILNKLCQQGYLNEKEISLRWAQSLIRYRGWGKAKIALYLLQKGISKDIIENVQREVWQQFSEEDMAGKALKKRFPSAKGHAPQRKQASFLQRRGFSADVICKVIRGLPEDN